ncbi:hypothetical protein F4778DRAFT_766813, partial [Xylariomycetidae sp. FL2044]
MSYFAEESPLIIAHPINPLPFSRIRTRTRLSRPPPLPRSRPTSFFPSLRTPSRRRRRRLRVSQLPPIPSDRLPLARLILEHAALPDLHDPIAMRPTAIEGLRDPDSLDRVAGPGLHRLEPQGHAVRLRRVRAVRRRGVEEGRELGVQGPARARQRERGGGPARLGLAVGGPDVDYGGGGLGEIGVDSLRISGAERRSSTAGWGR